MVLLRVLLLFPAVFVVKPQLSGTSITLCLAQLLLRLLLKSISRGLAIPTLWLHPELTFIPSNPGGAEVKLVRPSGSPSELEDKILNNDEHPSFRPNKDVLEKPAANKIEK